MKVCLTPKHSLCELAKELRVVGQGIHCLQAKTDTAPPDACQCSAIPRFLSHTDCFEYKLPILRPLASFKAPTQKEAGALSFWFLLLREDYA
jgi:hypothetical protein